MSNRTEISEQLKRSPDAVDIIQCAVVLKELCQLSCIWKVDSSLNSTAPSETRADMEEGTFETSPSHQKYALDE